MRQSWLCAGRVGCISPGRHTTLCCFQTALYSLRSLKEGASTPMPAERHMHMAFCAGTGWHA